MIFLNEGKSAVDFNVMFCQKHCSSCHPVPNISRYLRLSSLYAEQSSTLYNSRLRGEWPSGLNSSRQVTEVKLGRLNSNSGWVTSEA